MAFAIIASKPGGREVLRKIDIDMPVPSATDVLIRQTAIDVNFTPPSVQDCIHGR